MLATIRRLALGLFLIAGASALLLLSDLGSRVNARQHESAHGESRKVAVLQHASQPVLDESREGLFAGLAERGWLEGKNLVVKRYNAEGDMTVAQAIGREMANGGNDLLLTISTPSLQAVANANRTTRIPHVFGVVTDPKASGVGISSPTEHPAWLTGNGTMQPVKQAFETARAINPNLKSVGVIYNAGEANAVAQIVLARQVCSDLGITLSETTVDTSAGVGEAAAALAARGPEAIWVCGDVTVLTAIDAVIAAAKKAGIPVFTVIPPNIKRGALFDLGADYREVGRLTGLVAGDVLNGTDPATIPVDNVMPEMLGINLQTAAQLGAPWQIPEAVRKKARMIIDEKGEDQSPAAPAATPAPAAATGPSKKWKIAVVLYNESPPAEETLEGMADGWKASSLEEGRDYTIKVRSAQGDMSAIAGILDAAVTEGADIIVPLSTPTMQTAINRIRKTPIVFSLVADPMIAGAGKSYEDHLPNVTGVAVMGPFGEMLDLLQKYYPQYKRLGTLFCPAEVNSVGLKDALEAECKKRGFTLEAVAANTPGELPDAALSMVSRPIDAVVQISDNLSSSGFTAITKAARHARKPLFSLNSTMVPQGAAIAMGRDYHAAGEATVGMIERVIRGENPADIPIILPPKVVRVISLPNAKAAGMAIPEELKKEADKVIEE
jgi:ABC-type uncharacterized transport system substrate-binding protein